MGIAGATQAARRAAAPPSGDAYREFAPFYDRFTADYEYDGWRSIEERDSTDMQSQSSAAPGPLTFSCPDCCRVEGKRDVTRKGCTPRVSFHPKVLILRGSDAVGVAAGSGNLSRNGMPLLPAWVQTEACAAKTSLIRSERIPWTNQLASCAGWERVSRNCVQCRNYPPMI